MKNSNEYIVHLDQAPLGLPAREYYLDDVNVRYISAYKVFIMTIARLMGAQPVSLEKDVDDMIRFEEQLARIMASSEERRNISDVYLRYAGSSSAVKTTKTVELKGKHTEKYSILGRILPPCRCIFLSSTGKIMST